jgi:predicted alpha/beta-fold hydrolase
MTIYISISGLDWTEPEGEELAPTTPIIVVLHGLAGGSYESYIRSILSRACLSKSKGGLGYRAVVMNFRGCMCPSAVFRVVEYDARIVAIQVPALS